VKELLFEIGCEELPASYAIAALAELPGIVSRELSDRGLKVEPKDVKTAGTPRRLAIGVASLPDSTPKVKKTLTGPPTSAAYKDGKPTKAAEGFAAKNGVGVDKLRIEKTDKGEYIAVDVEEGGKATGEVLAEALPKVIEKIPFPKTMRWADMEVKFARPVHWIVAALGGKVIPFEWGRIKAGTVTHGHRFLAPKAVEVSTWAGYEAALEKAHVVVDPKKRREKVKAMADAAAKSKGGTIEPDDKLLDTVSFLIEEPTPVVGGFDPKLLELPKDVIVTPMKHHQKYFPVVDAKGQLLPHFVTIANVPPKDPAVVARGNERVLRSRLADAKFFFDEDLEGSLAEMAKGLGGLTFQEKLGTYADKVARMRELARAIGEYVGSKVPAAELDLAADLAKADLKSKMVYEFPELQGVMGREYARRQKIAPEIADAIAEHYQPRFAGDAVPKGERGAIVSLADRIDTLAGIFGIGEKPSGSADPYGLRRHAIAVIAILRDKRWHLPLPETIERAAKGLGSRVADPAKTRAEAAEFVKGRLENVLREEGLPYDAVDAALSARFSDVLEAIERVKAVAEVKKNPDLEPVAIGFKRARNILADKKAAPDLGSAVDPSAFKDDSERGLHKAAGAVGEAVKGHAKAGRWTEALKETVKLRGPIDTFYEKVMVMDPDAKVRKNRLALLQQVVAIFDGIADFTKLVAG
jgi:glycyl-tRNA synthetase beta chain